MVVYNSEQLKMFFDCWKSQFGALMSIVIMTFALQCRFNDCNKADDWSSDQCTSGHNVVSHWRRRSMCNYDIWTIIIANKLLCIEVPYIKWLSKMYMLVSNANG